MALLAQGMSNKEIARGLGICPSTVKKNMQDIFHRLEVTSRAKLVARFTTFEPTFSEA